MTATTSKRETRKTGRREDGRAHRLGIPNAPMPRKGDVACFFACHVFLPPRALNPKWSKHRNSLPFFFFLSQTLHSASAKNGGGNFSAPPRDDSETFATSVAGQSNWNAYEGAGEKALTPEELKAKNAKEDADAAARKAAAIKANQEYAKNNGA